jgi:hypothetical protein
MMKKRIGIVGLCLILTGTLLGGCGAEDEVEQVVDCSKICRQYDDCIDDDDFDVTECVDRCQKNADDSETYADQADSCESCLDDKSCSEGFACTAECAGILP